jgi:hypothetical protein
MLYSHIQYFDENIKLLSYKYRQIILIAFGIYLSQDDEQALSITC